VQRSALCPASVALRPVLTPRAVTLQSTAKRAAGTVDVASPGVEGAVSYGGAAPAPAPRYAAAPASFAPKVRLAAPGIPVNTRARAHRCCCARILITPRRGASVAPASARERTALSVMGCSGSGDGTSGLAAKCSPAMKAQPLRAARLGPVTGGASLQPEPCLRWRSLQLTWTQRGTC
jgi:hypothetical protein